MISYKTLTDNELMELIIKRNILAFSEIYDRYNKLMINYFYKMLWQDREKAEDFMQDLFTKIIEKPKYYDTSRNFKTWLFSVANNMCKNEYRKQAVRSNTTNNIDKEVQVKDNSINAMQQTDNNTFNAKLKEELDRLDEKQKSTFIMRYFDDMPIKEIAEALDCSEGTIKSRLFYTLKKLAVSLKDFSPQFVQILIALFVLNK
jgi:RNA polymerase sigma-70 factor (ECF subfamily)